MPDSIGRTIKYQRKLLANLSPFVNKVCDRLVFTELVATLWDIFHSRVLASVIRDSLFDVLNVALTKERLTALSWRFAANASLLRQGRSVSQWTHQSVEDWVVVQSVQTEPYRNKYGDAGLLFSMRILTGETAGFVVRKFWSNKLCWYVAVLLGFTRSYGKWPMEDQNELIGLRLRVSIRPGKGPKPFIDKIQKPQPTTLLAYNRKLIKQRRRENFTCPNKFTHPCYNCHVGYDQCPVALHPRTYFKRYCRHCLRSDAWFNPLTVKNGMCVECTKKKALARA